jgi:hypothetical protein
MFDEPLWVALIMPKSCSLENGVVGTGTRDSLDMTAPKRRANERHTNSFTPWSMVQAGILLRKQWQTSDAR